MRYKNIYYSYLFIHRDDKKLYLSTLMKDFYKIYVNYTKNGTDRVDFSDLIKLLHFIRKGKTPLYNSKYREFFCLKDINSIVNKSSSTLMDDKIDLFQKQYYFLSKIFDYIAKESNQKSRSPYNFSKYFKEFNEKFYINDKGVTQHKMIDYAIWYS